VKRVLFGLILGLGLMFPFSTAGAEVFSMIGKKIEGSFPVTLNGQRAEKDAIVVEGTSYLPIRVVAELFNADVAFIDSEIVITPKGGVYLTDEEKKAKSEDLKKKAADEQAKFDEGTRIENEKNEIKRMRNVLLTELSIKKSKLQNAQHEMAVFGEMLADMKLPTNSDKKTLSEYEQGRAKLEAKIKSLESTIGTLNSEVEDIENQITQIDEKIQQMGSTP